MGMLCTSMHLFSCSYVDYLGLEGPCDDIRLVLYQTALAMGSTIRVRTHEGKWFTPSVLFPINLHDKAIPKLRNHLQKILVSEVTETMKVQLW